MTVKTATCAAVVALLTGSVFFIAPADAQTSQYTAHKSSSHAQRLYMSAVAEYDAGLRRGSANSSDRAYFRGFRDGESTEAYGAQGYYSSYGNTAAYDTQPVGYSGYVGYSRYDGRYVSYNNSHNNSYDNSSDYSYNSSYNNSYDNYSYNNSYNNGYVTAGYNGGYGSSYCTYLASDGNRYYC